MDSPPVDLKSSLSSFRGFVAAEWRLIVLQYLMFGLPSLLWEIASSRLFAKPPAGYALVSIAVGALYSFGILSLALHAFAWLEQRKSGIAALSRQTWKLFGAFIGTRLAQLVPLMLILLPLIVLALLARRSWNNIQIQRIFQGLSGTVSPFLFFFCCPLFVLRGLGGLHNVSRAIRMSIEQARQAAVLASPLIVLAVLIFAVSPASALTPPLYALDNVLSFLMAGLQVCAFPPEL
jgi:hypothetical protein